MKPNSTRLGDHEGFDIEIARHLAEYLGYRENSVELIDTEAQNRPHYLNDGVVDVIVASYSITPEREARDVDFAGPYLRTPLEVLMKADKARGGKATFRQLGEMGKRLCTVGSSTSDDELKRNGVFGFDGVADPAECVDGLRLGTDGNDSKYDAFMLDEAVLAGYKALDSTLVIVDLVSDRTEYYGIAGANNDEFLRVVIGNFLLDSYERGENGARQQAWNKTLGRVLGGKRQPKPNDYKRLRDYRDRIKIDAGALSRIRGREATAVWLPLQLASARATAESPLTGW